MMSLPQSCPICSFSSSTHARSRRPPLDPRGGGWEDGSVLKLALLPVIGFLVGSYGTIVGAGGGFLLVPILLFLYPHEDPARVTAVSLAVIFFNALSGTSAYARQRRVDYLSGVILSAAAVPGAVLGALATHRLGSATFKLMFGLLLLAVSLVIIVQPQPTRPARTRVPGRFRREVTDRDGNTYVFWYDLRLAVVLTFAAGFVSSLLGIGGGIIHVPALVLLLGFPIHLATATSHFVLTVTVLAGALVHLAAGEYGGAWQRTLLLAVGVMPGAQIGAWLSTRLGGPLIGRLLGLALLGVSVRLLLTVL